MIKFRTLPSQDELLRLFEYDPMTGAVHPRTRAKVRIKNGRYFVVSVGRSSAFCHRVIWKMMTGVDAPVEVDHKDGDGFNNRWENLRLATRHGNMRNSRRHKIKKEDLPKGVSRVSSTTYRATICVNRKQIHLGCFRAPGAAHAAYADAANKHFGAFARIA